MDHIDTELLGIPAGSPEAAIFTNSSSSTTTAPTTAGQSAPEKAGSPSGTPKLGPHYGGLMALAITIFFFAFPAVGSATASNLYV